MSTEIALIVTNPAPAIWLQWGRALMSTEINLLRNNVTSDRRLQWGRALMSTEMPLPQAGAMPRVRGFNGAVL